MRKRNLLLSLAIALSWCTTVAQQIEYVGIETPLDGPGMVRQVLLPEQVSSFMYELWNDDEPMTREQVTKLAARLDMELLDTISEAVIDPEPGEPPVVLTLIAGINCDMSRHMVKNTSPDAEPGDEMEQIDFGCRRPGPYNVMVINIFGDEDGMFSLNNSTESSLRVAFSNIDFRNAALKDLLKRTGYKKVEGEDGVYAGLDGNEPDYGNVLTVTDDEDDGLYWIEFCSFL